MRHLIVATLLAMCVLLAGCGAPDAPPPAPEAATPPAAPPTAAAPVDTAPPAASPPAAATHLIALSADGLDIVDAATGSTRHLAFGLPADEVSAAVARVRDVEPQLATNTDCSAGATDFSTTPEGLTVLSRDGTFVGWSVNPRTDPARVPVTTLAGIGLGSTRRELEDAYDVTIEETAAGVEFRAGGLRGMLQSTAPDARITALRGGETCGYR